MALKTYLLILYTILHLDLTSCQDYKLTDNKIGVFVEKVDLSEYMTKYAVDIILEGALSASMVIFKDQDKMTGSRQVEISEWFGHVEKRYPVHTKSPDPAVVRISNDPDEGFEVSGSEGWHTDGSEWKTPAAYGLYHILEASDSGTTDFVLLYDVVSKLQPQRRARWDRLWVLLKYDNSIPQPLIYTHPNTDKETLFVHTQNVEHFIWDYGSATERNTQTTETLEINQEIEAEITQDDEALVYHHKWDAGDFIITDNLAVAHKACSVARDSVRDIGRRILHRTIVKGAVRPTKSDKAAHTEL